MKRFVLVLFCALCAHAGISAPVSFARSGLEISCSISDRNHPLKEYTILILEDGAVRDTVFADLELPIFIQLELNKSYLLEFSKTGFMERLILVDTKVPAGKERKRFTYEFEIDMPYAYRDTGLYAVQPVARIIYDTLTGAFGYDVQYAKSIGNLPEIVAPAEQGDGKSPAKKSTGKKGAMRRRL